jgi:hypothetical protein
MMYLVPSGSDNVQGLSMDRFGIIRTPAGGNAWGIQNGYSWAADNGAFTSGFKPKKFFAWLEKMLPWQSTCLFVACPDVVYNAIATMDNYRLWAWRIKDMGYPVAFIAQDGQEGFPFPPEYDWLFVGGSTEWKLSEAAIFCIRWAKQNGKPVHVGRVNSKSRTDYFKLYDVDSVDGTHWIYEPDNAKIQINKWISQPVLFNLL